tara:strand:- start:43508 stop:43693 length:186 start_codon:yes stop_codon:yes gene_type:complete
MGCLFSFLNTVVEEPTTPDYLSYNEPFIKKERSFDNYSIDSCDSPSYNERVFNRFHRTTGD